MLEEKNELILVQGKLVLQLFYSKSHRKHHFQEKKKNIFFQILN